MAVQSVRSNPVGPGGVTATNPVPPSNTPASISDLVDSLTPVISRFRQSSSPLAVALAQDTLVLGQEDSIRISSVGLGERIVRWHHVVITVANTSGATQTVSVSPHFPYNMLANTAVQINGGEVSYSCSGRGGLAVFGRDRTGFWEPVPGPGLSPAFCQVTITGTGVTTTASTGMASFSGFASFAVTTANTATITADFMTVEKLAESRNTLIGALPLQNSSTYATLTTRVVGSINGSNAQSPLYQAGGFVANLTPSLSTYTIQGSYHFWGIPADPGLYQPLIANSYQVLEQKSLTTSATGSGALVYNVPENLYLRALHFFVNDNNGANVSCYGLGTASTVGRMVLTYNAGSITPVLQFPERARATQYADYGADLGAVPGYRLWDGDDTSESLVITDDAGWIDAYSAASPQVLFDINGSPATPISFNVTREAIVAGSVQQVGG